MAGFVVGVEGMTIKYYTDLIQGSEEWLAARCGLLTASEMKHIITPTLKVADNDKSRAHLYELLAQRITKYVEPHYISDDMLRGMNDEQDAKVLYDEHYDKIETTGFITNDKWGFTLGYSPDALIGKTGALECKSRRQKFQIETILTDEMPAEYSIQVQTGLLVSEREWLDFISYSGGMPMFTTRIYNDEKVQAAIILAAKAFEEKLGEMLEKYNARLTAPGARLIPTERKIIQEMHL